MTPLSACPADLLSYAGRVLCIALSPASLSLSPTLRPTESQDPLGCCLNWKCILNSFATHSACMNQFAFLVPNHENRCGTNCCCFCFCELSVVVFAICEKSVVTRDYWHISVILGLSSVVIPCRSHYTVTAPRSKWVVINHMSLNLSVEGFLGCGLALIPPDSPSSSAPPSSSVSSRPQMFSRLFVGSSGLTGWSPAA